MTHRLLGLVAGSLLLSLSVLALGQTFGEITGAVTDASGGAVANATVTVTNPQTDFRRATTTNTAGPSAIERRQHPERDAQKIATTCFSQPATPNSSRRL